MVVLINDDKYQSLSFLWKPKTKTPFSLFSFWWWSWWSQRWSSSWSWIMIMTMIITTLIMTTMVFRSNSFLPFHSSALFSVDPLTSVRRSFQVKIIIIIVIIIITIIIIVIVIIINIIMIMMILQDIQAGVGRSMRSLMAAGSAIGHRMLGMITRAPSIIVIVFWLCFRL